MNAESKFAHGRASGAPSSDLPLARRAQIVGPGAMIAAEDVLIEDAQEIVGLGRPDRQFMRWRRLAGDWFSLVEHDQCSFDGCTICHQEHHAGARS